MSRRGTALASALLAGVLLAPQTRAEEPDVPPVVEILPIRNPLGNFGVVSKGVYRSERLDAEEDYAFLAGTLGVDTVVNLRYFHTDDRRLCRKYGLRCVNYRLRPFEEDEEPLDWYVLKAAFRHTVKEQAAGRGVHMHCLHGSDRTGALASAVMIRDRACGRDYDKDKLWEFIRTTLKQYGFHDVYVNIYLKIKGWVYKLDRNPWICEDPADMEVPGRSES